MADLDATNVIAGQARVGGVYLAPAGTTVPTDSDSTLDAAFKPVGYVSEDGVTLSQELETEDIVAWQSASPVRTLVKSRVAKVEFTMIEIKAETLAAWWGEAIPTVTAGEFSLTVRSDVTLPEYVCVIDLKDGSNLTRFVANRAQLAEAGDIEMKRESAVGLPVTLTTLDDDGVLMYVYSSQPA